MLLDDFIRYVKIDTQSDDESELTPSTLKQYDLLNLIKKELDELKVETKLDEYTADCIANSANSIEGVAPFPVKYHGGAKTLTVKISASGSIYLRTVIGEF